MSFLTPSNPAQQGWRSRKIKYYRMKCLAEQYFAPPFLKENLVLVPPYLSLASKIMFKVHFGFENIPD